MSTGQTAAPGSDGLQSVTRVANVLRALAPSPHGLTLTELSTTIGLPKSTLHRLLGALEREGLVQKAQRRYAPGTLLSRLGAATDRTLRDELRPYMQSLSDELGETVDLAVLDRRGVRFIEQVGAPRRLRAVSSVGEIFPLHCTANGKALLAALARREASAILPARLPSMTSATITSRRALWEELDRVNMTGVAFDREEHTIGICAVGAVVTDDFGPAAALTIPLPAPRFSGREAEFAAQIKRTAGAASAALARTSR